MTLFPCKIIIKKHMENNMCYECPASNIEKKIRSIYTIFIQHWQTNISVKSLMNNYYCFYLLVVPILSLYIFYYNFSYFSRSIIDLLLLHLIQLAIIFCFFCSYRAIILNIIFQSLLDFNVKSRLQNTSISKLAWINFDDIVENG